jgi:hypothetical protein
VLKVDKDLMAWIGDEQLAAVPVLKVGERGDTRTGGEQRTAVPVPKVEKRRYQDWRQTADCSADADNRHKGRHIEVDGIRDKLLWET